MMISCSGLYCYYPSLLSTEQLADPPGWAERDQPLLVCYTSHYTIINPDGRSAAAGSAGSLARPGGQAGEWQGACAE